MIKVYMKEEFTFVSDSQLNNVELAVRPQVEEIAGQIDELTLTLQDLISNLSEYIPDENAPEQAQQAIANINEIIYDMNTNGSVAKMLGYFIT